MLLSDPSQGLCSSFQFRPKAMRRLLYKSGSGIGLALLSSASLAATQEELLSTLIGQIQMYLLIAFVIIVIAGVYFMRSRDKR